MLKANKNYIWVILLLLSLFSQMYSQENPWQQMADMPEGKTTSVGAINGKIYIMGVGSTSKIFLEYDPVTDAYKSLADLPVSRSSIPAGAAANGHFYTFGGNAGFGKPAVEPVYAYNPVTDSWKEVTNMPSARYLLRVCACDGKIYTGGGYYVPKAMGIYDPVSDTWDVRSENAPPMGAQAMCSYNGKVYCFGGAYGLHDTWEYDPSTDTWTAKSPMPTGRFGAAAACVNGMIYVISGAPDAVYPNHFPLDVVEAYDPETDKWYVGYPPIPTPRFWAGACTVDSLIYVIGGYQGNWGAGAQTVNEAFNPALATGIEEYNDTPDDSRQTWELNYTGARDIYPDQQFRPIKVVDENVVWIGGTNGVFFKTTDGGESWTHGVVPGAESLTFYSIAAFDGETAHFMASKVSDVRIYMTTDGGLTWTMTYKNTMSGAFLNSMAFFDAENGIAVGDPVAGSFLILTTDNGGVGWQQVPAENIPSSNSGEWGAYAGFGGTGLAVSGSKHAWFGTGYGSFASNEPLRVLYSNDRGQTWSVSDTPLPTTGQYHGITTVAFKDSLVGFAASSGSDEKGEGKNLVKTVDGGKSWSVVKNYVKTNSQTSTIQFVPGTGSQLIVASTSGGLVRSRDGGDTWELIDNDGFYGIDFISPTVGWGTTGYGLVGKFIGDLTSYPVFVETGESNNPQEFKLRPNYPNPFNPSTTIEYTLPKDDIVTMKIYNLLGKEIRTLVNERQSAGAHSIVFEAGELPSGLYLYSIQTGDFVETRKMLLVR